MTRQAEKETNTPQEKKDKNATNTYKPRTGYTMQPRPRRPPCRRPRPHTTPAASRHAQRRNAQIKGKQPEQIAA
jgi:hypothetical protein